MDDEGLKKRITALKRGSDRRKGGTEQNPSPVKEKAAHHIQTVALRLRNRPCSERTRPSVLGRTPSFILSIFAHFVP